MLELQRKAEHRLCEIRVDEPRTKGVPPMRHTSYRVSSRIRSDRTCAWAEDWEHCRKRYSDFELLQADVVAFLPGISLPPLPEKHVSSPLSNTVVDAHVHGLQALLQAMVDHPFAATSDALAAGGPALRRIATAAAHHGAVLGSR